MAEGKSDWVFDDAARARVQVALDALDRRHEVLPECALCGQRAATLDRFGLCSKTSKPHMEWRAGIRADTKAGIR